MAVDGAQILEWFLIGYIAGGFAVMVALAILMSVYDFIRRGR